MSSFPLLIATPSGAAFRGEAAQLSLRGSEGDLAILAGHIPLVTPVVPGVCRVLLPDGSVRQGTVSDGLLYVSGTEVNLIAGTFAWDESNN